MRAKIIKNKVAPPFKTCEFDIYYNEGISYTADLLAAGVREGVIGKAGSWLQYDKMKLGQGAEASKKFLEENPNVLKDIKKELLTGSREKA